MMRRSAGFDADKARRQLLKEWYNVPALELTANDYITCRVNSVDLKNRLRDIETDCRDRLHVWLLRIVGASTAPTSMALPCRWRSRPQHQKRTHAPQQSISIRSPCRHTNIGPIVHQFCALSRASIIFFASATIASLGLFSSVAGLSGSADDEPGGKIIALQPFPTGLTSRRYPL